MFRGSISPARSSTRHRPITSPATSVILTGWRVGEAQWGGYAQKARVKASQLVHLPAGLSTKQAMAIGTAGFTAMLAVMALEDHGLKPGAGEVLVTGAAGGVGSVSVALLAKLGHKVTASTGRPETPRLSQRPRRRRLHRPRRSGQGADAAPRQRTMGRRHRQRRRHDARDARHPARLPRQRCRPAASPAAATSR